MVEQSDRQPWQAYLADLIEGNRLNAARIARLNGERAKLNEPEKTRSLARALPCRGGEHGRQARKC